MPIYAWNKIWSKSNLVSYEDISKIPFQDFDLLNKGFIEQINKNLIEEKSVKLDCYYTNKNKQAEIVISFNPLKKTLIVYHENGNKKHITSTLNNQLNGKCLHWHSNGQLKEQMNFNGNNIINCTRFFDTGNKELFTNHDENGKLLLFKMWYENGQLCSKKNHEDGISFRYSENGKIISKGIRTGNTDDEGTIIWEYNDDEKLKKEIKRYYIDGLLHGFEKTYYDTGEIRRFVDYANGHDKKLITTFKKNGEISTKK